MNRALVLFLSVLIAIAGATGVRAQAQEAGAGGPPGYREAVEQALTEYGVGNYEEASALFARAHALSPNARTLRGLGMAAFELRRYEESIQHLEAALASKEKPLEGELRGEAESLLARARAFVARVTVDLSPREAALSVDGHSIASPIPNPLMLRLGEHVLEATAPGYKPARRELRVRGGEVVRTGLELERDALADVAPVERPTKRPLYKNPWLWTAVGVVVAGGATAGALLATRDRETRIVPVDTDHAVGARLDSLWTRR